MLDRASLSADMGKASSAKKVARAARSGGAAQKRNRPKLAFPLALFAIVVFGALLVVYARTSNSEAASADTAPSYLKQDHWHAAYGIYTCDKFIAPLTDIKDDTQGIHTHGEGIIHIHPFTAAASGLKANMKTFGAQVGLTFSDNGFTLPDGTEYKNGTDCNGKPGHVAVYKWKVDDPTAPVQVFENNFGKINFTEDRDAYTIAILPEGAPEPPPQPDSVAELDKLTDVAGANPAGAAGAAGSGGLTTGGATPSVSTPSDPSVSTPTPSDPAVSTPAVSTPAVSDPAVSTPAVSTPAASTPAVSTPAVSTPAVSTPAASTP